MNLLTCMLTENLCYTTAQAVTPCGVMIHSTGANNPNLRRYVQPSEGDPDYERLMALLGRNRYSNDWNRPQPGGNKVCVHGFIGRLADGTVAQVQTLPWDIVGWHSGYANKYSTTNANKLGYIGIEICEDGLDDPDYFTEIYRAAVELTAYLCRLYGFDPLGHNQYGYPCITCHREGYDLGIAYCHADVLHWFPRYGKDMGAFRADVADYMRKDDFDMDINEARNALTSCADTGDKPSGWAQEATDYCKRKGIFAGDGKGNFGWQQPITREAVAQIIYNVLETAGVLDKLPDV